MLEPLWIFSEQDNSIDIVGAFVYGFVIYQCIKLLIRNHLNQKGKILFSVIIALSVSHIFQTIMQFIVGGPIGEFTFRLWDFINYLQAILFLMLTSRIYKNEQLREHD